MPPLTLQIDVAVNATEAGTIKEFFANEEDTVTVGQDLVKIELGGAPAGGESKEAPKKEEASSEAKSSSSESDKQPKAPKESESKPEPKKEAPAPKKDSPSAKKEAQPPKESSGSTLGNREERRVSLTGGFIVFFAWLWMCADFLSGQNEPYATPHR